MLSLLRLSDTLFAFRILCFFNQFIAALGILTSTVWDGLVSASRQSRERLAQLLGLPSLGRSVAISATLTGQGSEISSRVVGHSHAVGGDSGKNESYEALVREMGY